MSTRQRAAVLVGILISAVFLWFAFRNLHPEAVWNELQQANVWWLLAGAAWFFVSMYFMALRWQFLLRAVRAVALSGLWRLVAIGYMGNNVYPFRSGEALRAFLLQRNEGVPVMRGATTVVVERVFDGLVMLTFLLLGLALSDIVSSDVQRLIAVAAPVFLTATAVFFLLAARPNLLRALVRLTARILPGRLEELVTRLGEDIISGLEGLRSPAHLAGTVFASYASWITHAGVYWMVAAAFGIQTTLPVMLAVVGAVNLAGLVPATPGQLGVFEFFASAVMVASGVPEALALGYAIVVHVVIWLPVTLLGFFYLVRQGLGWRAITRARELEERAAGQPQQP